jgi:RNA-directed DNA polymerase
MDRSSYIVHRIPKRSGGWREILEPNPELKRLQGQLLRWLTARRVRVGPYAHGFVRGRSILTHALLHAGRRVVVRMDVRDFFPSIRSEMVSTSLLHEGLSIDDARRFSELCTVDGRLPQGAPTSPLLANLAFKHVDFRLAALTRALRPRFPSAYSRYADDLVFSSDAPDWQEVIFPVRKIVESAGFKLHPRKTHVARSHCSQRVTGLVVNSRPNVPREYRRNLRAELHEVRKSVRAGRAVEKDWQVLRGKAAYVHQVNTLLGRSLLQQVDDLQSMNALLRKEDDRGSHHDP